MTFSEAHQQKVRALLGGQEAPLIDGQRHILAHCPRCHRRWLQRGPTQLLHLSEDEARAWAARLHADLAHLPRRACRPCQIRVIGGEFAIDEYVDAASGAITGYGLSWECSTPPQHVLVTGVLTDWLQRQAIPPAPSVVTNAALAETVIRSLTHLPSSPGAQPLPTAMLTLLAQTNLPGAHAPGTAHWVWQGALWTIACPALGGDLCVSFAQALPPEAHFSLPAALSLWRQITTHALSFGIEGAS